MYIKLHRFSNNKDILINTDHISAIYEGDNSFVYVSTITGTFRVDESLDTIATMISYAHDIVYSSDNKCYTILQDNRNYIKR